MASRRSHSREFKLEAVRMITEQDLRASEVARGLDIHPNTPAEMEMAAGWRPTAGVFRLWKSVT